MIVVVGLPAYGATPDGQGSAGGLAVDVAAEAHIGADGAAALTHAVDFGFFDIEAGAKGDIREDVGGLDDALAA